ncbi:flagellar motor protein [Aliikangiella coralliicola]|uniref:Flagellar motor protein n=1 Tax=Aliikangiella coralliicola TaxID=2592383 RepID=A0A545UB50_9GAMM|nr:flagellar motor protein [Aliikangiella coralliicola]TQV86691.1 flagellar motor protein [Aliikangiella coralliicola]
MDRLTFLGLIIAIAAIFGGQLLEGGSVDALLDWAAFVIVVGGSVGAVMVQSHIKTFRKAMRILTWVFKPPMQPVEEGVTKVTAWSNLARREGLLGLEKNIDESIDPFILKGLNMLVDGNEPEAIRKALYVELDVQDKELLNAAKIFESMGGYSPTLGIVGAVLGLIHVMGNLSNPELLGSGIATAFVATIYGVGFANLFFIPIYHKLRAVIAQQSQYREMIVEGIACIAEGENPRVIEGKLSGYITR